MDGWGSKRADWRAVLLGLIACLALSALTPTPGKADEVAWMYNPDAVVEIHLGGLSEEELDALEAEPDVYQHGSFELTVDGVPKGSALADVGVRLKGGTGSGRPVKTGKSGLKVRFDKFVKGQLFFGLRGLTLNNMIQDPSMVHETLSYELFRALGLPASRTGYAFVTLNGSDYGTFLNLEALDKVSLPHWFATTQHLYEADAPGTDLTTGSAGSFEVDEGDAKVITDLEALIVAVNDPEGDWSENVAPFADLEEMTKQWAVERFIAHWDGYAGIAGPFRPNNYYLHSDAAGLFQMMPWGTDQTWERDDLEFDEPAGGVMVNSCLADASCKRLYLEGLTAVYCAVPHLEEKAHAGQLAAMLAPYQAREDEAKRETSPAEIAAEVEAVEGFASLRPEQLAQYLTAEGILGADPTPCGETPAPAGGPVKEDATPAPPQPTTARIGRPHAAGRFIATPLDVTGEAKATERVFAPIDGRRRRLCADQSGRSTAGRLLVRCRLPNWALNRLAEGPLRLQVHIGFAPELGDSRVVGRSLTLPRR